MVGPDFSKVDSKAKALALVDEGVLEPILLMPVEFGGEDRPEYRLYVPVGLTAVKHSHDMNVIRPLIAEGLVTQYEAIPAYEGNSVVPVSICVRAFEPRDVTFTLAIWGSGLEEMEAVEREAAEEAEKAERPWWKFW